MNKTVDTVRERERERERELYFNKVSFVKYAKNKRIDCV